jgi:leader peptidase (prepilin peptidase)/N-methyltransferase
MVFVLYLILYGLLFAVGACLYSFLNVIVFRIPRGESFLRGRSRCPSCGRELTAGDLVPIFSFLFLRGKCRTCGEKIPVRDTLTEGFGGALACLCFWQYGGSPKAILAFGFLFLLTATALIDADTMEIPDGFSIGIALLGGIAFFIFPEIDGKARLIGAVVVSLPLFLLTLLIPGAFGGGDIKLTAAAGLFLGWKLVLIALMLAILSGGGYGAYLLAKKKLGRKDHFAFGPFLCAGMGISLLWGEALLAWYWSLWW